MILVPHSPLWTAEFEALRSVYAAALGDLILRVEHVGSTAIPGLRAKPIIDIDIVMAGYGSFPKIVEGLAALGYKHNGDQGITHREAFNRADATVPYCQPPKQWPQHYLYVCPADSEELRRHILFRDALRHRADWRAEYEAIKQGIANRSADDRKKYAEIKEAECREFVEHVLRECAASDFAPKRPA